VVPVGFTKRSELRISHIHATSEWSATPPSHTLTIKNRNLLTKEECDTSSNDPPLLRALLFAAFLPMPASAQKLPFFCRWFDIPFWCEEEEEDEKLLLLDHPNLNWAPDDVAIQDQYMIFFDDGSVHAENVNEKAMALLLAQSPEAVLLHTYTHGILKGFAVQGLSEQSLLGILEDVDVDHVSQVSNQDTLSNTFG
jgi:hypothetical protein